MEVLCMDILTMEHICIFSQIARYYSLYLFLSFFRYIITLYIFRDVYYQLQSGVK